MGEQDKHHHEGLNTLPCVREYQKLGKTIQIPSSLLAQLLNTNGNAQIQFPSSLHAQFIAQLVNPIEHRSKGEDYGPT